ncbi:3alpha(or 20beta)-hydroxysteroid dehydrogenase [Leucobacter exalbidus]|uniref:3alpha(Or 20beta)-hydroxysteroid dehydrogenase n=1 Tax=Leucobacter exalbidus TaxID=662960 RepID=A0A940T6T1_9MICO|nr:glucose 1-dehydrogenase [Leucobacter exalbidus]MBP1327316.1 3alpha(or 20beta)-hydroxysteroid dehydrogenase [Leucobacter exalbidus]
MGRVEGKIALVTGGSQGLGEAIARALIEDGARVVVTGRNPENVDAAVVRLGENARGAILEVSDVAQWDDAVNYTLEQFGKIDILVNNAGIANFGHLADYTHEQWHAAIDTNLHGPFNGIKAVIPHMSEAGGGVILNVASIASQRAAQNLAGYVSSKFGLRGLTKQAAIDLAELNIRVNSINPGAFVTPLTEGLDQTQKHVPQKRMGQPWEMANLVLFLASDESPFITGSEFTIDGGETAGRVKH